MWPTQSRAGRGQCTADRAKTHFLYVYLVGMDVRRRGGWNFSLWIKAPIKCRSGLLPLQRLPSTRMQHCSMVCDLLTFFRYVAEASGKPKKWMLLDELWWFGGLVVDVNNGQCECTTIRRIGRLAGRTLSRDGLDAEATRERLSELSRTVKRRPMHLEKGELMSRKVGTEVGRMVERSHNAQRTTTKIYLSSPSVGSMLLQLCRLLRGTKTQVRCSSHSKPNKRRF